MTIEADRASDALIARALGAITVDVWAMRDPECGDWSPCTCAGQTERERQDDPSDHKHDWEGHYRQDYATIITYNEHDADPSVSYELVPAYTTDPAAMLALVEEMRERGWWYEIFGTADGHAGRFTNQGGLRHTRIAPTAPLAVARSSYAALTALVSYDAIGFISDEARARIDHSMDMDRLRIRLKAYDERISGDERAAHPHLAKVAEQKHLCHARDCTVEIETKLVMCLKHWRMVPKVMQNRIWSNYRPGQEIDKRPSRRYLNIQQSVVDYVAKLEGYA